MSLLQYFSISTSLESSSFETMANNDILSAQVDTQTIQSYQSYNNGKLAQISTTKAAIHY